MKRTAKPQNVGAYIAAASPGLRQKLRELRATIRRAAPVAEELISYGMPYYRHKGRLAYFAAFKHHIGLYIPTPIVAEHKKELKGYVTSGATVRLPLERKLPAALIRKLIKARLKKNEQRSRS